MTYSTFFIHFLATFHKIAMRILIIIIHSIYNVYKLKNKRKYIVHTVKLRGEDWLAVQPKASIPPPQGDGHTMKELLGASGGALGVDSPTNGLPKSADDGDGVLSQATHNYYTYNTFWG